MYSRRYESSDVCHIDEEKTAAALGNFRDAREVDDSRIRTRPCDDHLGLMLAREPVDFVVIDCLRFLGHSIGDELVGLAGEIERMPVSKMPAVSEIHSKNGRAGFERCH